MPGWGLMGLLLVPQPCRRTQPQPLGLPGGSVHPTTTLWGAPQASLCERYLHPPHPTSCSGVLVSEADFSFLPTEGGLSSDRCTLGE